MKWKKIFANDATNKGLIPKIYKQTAHTAQYIKKKKSNKKMGRRSKQTFLQEDIQKAHRHMKKILKTANYQRSANQN